jgi:hypothetical protein
MANLSITLTGMLIRENGEGQISMPMPGSFLDNLKKPGDQFHLLTVYTDLSITT